MKKEKILIEKKSDIQYKQRDNKCHCIKCSEKKWGERTESYQCPTILFQKLYVERVVFGTEICLRCHVTLLQGVFNTLDCN